MENISPIVAGNLLLGLLFSAGAYLTLAKVGRDLKRNLTENLVTKDQLTAALMAFRKELEIDLVTSQDLEVATLKLKEKVAQELTETRHTLRNEMQAHSLASQVSHKAIEDQMHNQKEMLARIEEHMKYAPKA